VRFHQTAVGEAQVQPMQVEVQAVAVQRRHRWQPAPIGSDNLRGATSLAITMAVCSPSGPGQHGRDGDRDGPESRSRGAVPHHSRSFTTRI
jgi:hypothetical protein